MARRLLRSFKHKRSQTKKYQIR